MRRFAVTTHPIFVTIALLVSFDVRAGEYMFQPTDQTFPNPERGLYDHAALVERSSFAGMRESGVSLVHAQIYLADYRERPISDDRLVEISDAFERTRVAGLKGIVRISYSNRIGRPDASLARVEEHLQQLDPSSRNTRT